MNRSDPERIERDAHLPAAALRERARIAAWLRDCAKVVRSLEQADALCWDRRRAELYEQIARSILAGEHLPGNPEGP
jgi:hypothetical protein